MAGSCVRVDPPLVAFKDVEVGQVYKIQVTAANVGRTSKNIRLGKPTSKLFKFTASRSFQFVAPGLSVSGLLEFTPEKNEEVRDCLPIHVDDTETIEVPLLGFPKTCSLVTDSVVDFGCLAASSQLIAKHHLITNKGSASGVFHVQYNGNPLVSFFPSSGVIAAGSTQWLRVELRTDEPGRIDETALVILQNSSPIILSIRAEVEHQHLEIFDVLEAPLSCLWFGPVYFGTSTVKKVVLRNNGPQSCDWVSLLQHKAAGTETGTDLQRRTDAALLERMKTCCPVAQDVSHVLVCFPNQGRLGPYDKTTVEIRFSPMRKSSTGGRKRDDSARQQDYCIFLLFESVRSKHGFTHLNGNSSVELAVTGSGLPVSLVPSPSDQFEFPPCMIGQRSSLSCVLQNICLKLPINFRFRKLPHFSTEPSSGVIPPGQCREVVLSFIARQQGSFRAHQKLDVLGFVQKKGSSTADVPGLEFCSFHTISLCLSAVCLSETVQPPPKLNPGITPVVTNPTGLQPHARSSELALCRKMARAAVLCANKTRLHEYQRPRSQNTDEFLAFPNDRATSLRPASASRQYRTIFTGIQRYRYMDSSYSFTEDEKKQRRQHRQIYTQFIRQLRETRLQRIKDREQEKVENDVDIGIIPAHGLVPPKLPVIGLEISAVKNGPNYRLVSSASKHLTSRYNTNQQVDNQVVNAVPCTSQEVADCNRTLTAQELYQVNIGPLLLDFGEVCVQSVCIQKLELTNRLSSFVWVQLEVDCPELQGSSPLSYVLAPHSHNILPLTFQSNKLGPFIRSLSYSVNQQHPGQILIQAQVVPLSLELSTNLLVLNPVPTLPAQSGYRSSVTLRNRRNHAAEFIWQPVVTENGILFSIRPATGVVDPYSELDCEVVWHPSFSSPSEGDFDLCVHNGNLQRLHCVAKVGISQVELADKHIIFESVPLNMPSFKTAVLQNSGQNHAYYQVQDVCVLSGLVVSPSEGVVPSGGKTTLQVHFNPESVIKFDTRIEIALRSMKSVELRVRGSVEPPNIDISVSNLKFHGVRAGSQKAIPFTLTNCSSADAWVAFDLSEYTDFSLQQPSSVKKKTSVSIVEVQGNQSVDCSLVFSPTQEASYDFQVPLIVSGVRWTAADVLSRSLTASSSFSSSTLGPMSAGSTRHVVKPRSVTMVTPQSLHIQATVLCAPLEMSPCSLQFYVEHLALQSHDYTQTADLKAVGESSVFWHLKEQVHWAFDCSAKDKRGGVLCTVSPSSGSLGPGQSVCLEVRIRPDSIRPESGGETKLVLPLYLEDEVIREEEGRQPYRELSITVSVHPPCITIRPPRILLTPVPLGSKATTLITLLASGYPSGTSVSAEVDEAELEDGTKIQPVSVSFPEGNNIPAPQQYEVPRVLSLICSVSFCSEVPLSLCTTITFTDYLDNRFKVELCAIADCCLLTVWPFMALHQSQQQIVLQPGATSAKAVLHHYPRASIVSCPTSSSSSLFSHSSSTNQTSDSDSYADTNSGSGQVSGDSDLSDGEIQTNLGVPEFPAANSEEGTYYQTVLLAVERWFSFFGWPGGLFPISVPHSLRRIVPKIETSLTSALTLRVTQNKGSKSVVDMLQHLTGIPIPGIPRSQTISSDLAQRTKQLIQQHKTMLAFLRVQGALLGHIRPECLLDVPEFKQWCSMQPNEKEHGLDYSSVDYESLSKRSWTDVLLQIFKALVLSRVSGSNLDDTLSTGGVEKIPPFNTLSLASNIYSSCELQLLSWLNTHYQSVRENVWGTGDGPPARWIVNFDRDFVDGLVLAAVLAAYCPYLIWSHFSRMYTRTYSLEQILHNNIIVFQALNALGLNLDVLPTDLADPNPVQMLILCVHLYERLPQYLPLQTVELSGGLHSTFSKRLRLKNPSSKPVKYRANIFGENAHLFSLPNGYAVMLSSNGSTEVSVLYSCSVMQPMEAFLLLISSSPFGPQGTTLTFRLKTHVSHITPSNTVKCKSPSYQLKVLEVPVTNPFNKEATFRVVLVESAFNPLKPEKKKDSLVQHSSSNVEGMTLGKSCKEEMEKCSDLNGESSEFHSMVRSVCLKPGQIDILSIHYLPFSPGTKYCSVLLVCPQVGDMVYMVKATAEMPLSSPLSARPSSNIASVPDSSAVSVSALSLRCRVGQVCKEVMRVPLVNMAWEQALAIWGQYSMSADEHRRRTLTRTFHSSTVRANTAAQKFITTQTTQLNDDAMEYNVEVSLPQYFTLPETVKIPLTQDDSVPWENPADCGFMDIPFRFKADCVGQFTCQVVLRSWCDIRVHILEALVTLQKETHRLNFSSPVYRSVTQDIPLHNDTCRDWRMQAVVCGEGFSGPKVVNVPAGTKVSYPLTFNPSTQRIIMGELTLQNDCDGTKTVFILRGVGEHPLPVDHVILHCPVGQTTYKQLDVPNYTQRKLTLKMVTDLSVVSGSPSVEIQPGHKASFTLSVSPWKRGKLTGCVSFVETDDKQDTDEEKGVVIDHYKVDFSLELICQPAAPTRVIDVQCSSQSSVDIEIPICNRQGKPLKLDVYLEGDNLSGADCFSLPPWETLTYKATFSPDVVGKTTGSVLFQSELVGEFWYQLQLYALPPPVLTLPQVCCQLGKWTKQTIPLVNPTAEALELLVANSNPRNYTVEMDSEGTLTVQPHSFTQLAVRFRPSCIGEGRHSTKITFMCPKVCVHTNLRTSADTQLQEWCVLLSGRGIRPEQQEPLSISSLIGSSSLITIPFTNPTELQVELDITITDVDPSGAAICCQVSADKEVFSVPLRPAKRLQMIEGASIDVPVVFAPNTMELKQAWICITMKPFSSPGSSRTFSTGSMKRVTKEELSTIQWVYPVFGIPLEAPLKELTLGVVQCEVGSQLEKKVDLLLTGCVPGNRDQRRQEVSEISTEDFVCTVRSDTETEHSKVANSLSASVKEARRDPETGIVTITLNVVCAPLRPCRLRAVIVVQNVSGGKWEFPLTLIASEPQVDDVIVIEATGLGETAAVGFRLTSTTRNPEQFRAMFLPGAGCEFTVSPASGMLPPVGSAGALLTVYFTPTTHGQQRATLIVQAADMQWTYEVKGKTPHSSLPLCIKFAKGSSTVRPPSNEKKNFVARNLRLPILANSSPLRVHRRKKSSYS